MPQSPASKAVTPSVFGSQGSGTTIVLVLVMFILYLSITGVLKKLKQGFKLSVKVSNPGTGPLPSIGEQLPPDPNNPASNAPYIPLPGQIRGINGPIGVGQ